MDKRTKVNRVGETRKAKNGMMMTIIEYLGYSNITVQFEDDAIVRNRSYSSFKHGNIAHPDYNAKKLQMAQKYIGKVFCTRKGFRFTIKAYRSNCDADIVFETGYKKTISLSSVFADHSVKHPLPYQVGTMIIQKPAYVVEDVGNFYCHCTKCGLRDIMSIKEMRDHICQ